MLVPEFWERRRSLIRWKAIHQLGGGLDAEALQSLDALDALYAAHAPHPVLDAEKLGNDILRALAMYRLKRTSEAEALLASVMQRRPYSTSIARTVNSLRLTFQPDAEKRLALLREQAVLDPSVLRVLFVMAMQDGEFERALAYSSEITLDAPRQRNGWRMQDADEVTEDKIETPAAIHGARAYALQALGRTKDAVQEMVDAHSEVTFAMAPPAGEKWSKQVKRDFEIRTRAGRRAKESLDDWTKAIAFRGRAAGLTLEEAGKDPARPKGDAVLVAADFIRQIKPADFAQAGLIDDLAQMVRQRAQAAMAKQLQFEFRSLVEQLPIAERAENLKMRRERSSFWMGPSLNGYRFNDAEDPALVDLRFGTEYGSRAQVDEAALLTAANHVASLGKDAFFVESRMTIKRTTTVTGYGTYTLNSGHEVRMLVRPVDSAALPPARSDSRWRMVKVADVQAALGAKYAAKP